MSGCNGSYIPSTSTEFLFSASSSGDSSRIFSVPLGGAVLLQAYNLAYEAIKHSKQGRMLPAKMQKVVIHQVASEQINREPSSSSDSGDCQTVDPILAAPMEFRAKASSCVMQGGEWSLTMRENMGILTTPGYYYLTLSEDDMIGTAVVTGLAIPHQYTITLPAGLIFGN